MSPDTELGTGRAGGELARLQEGGRAGQVESGQPGLWEVSGCYLRTPPWPARESPREIACGPAGTCSLALQMSKLVPPLPLVNDSPRTRVSPGSPQASPGHHLGTCTHVEVAGRAKARVQGLEAPRCGGYFLCCRGRAGAAGCQQGWTEWVADPGRTGNNGVEEKKRVSGRGTCQRSTGCCRAAAWRQRGQLRPSGRALPLVLARGWALLGWVTAGCSRRLWWVPPGQPARPHPARLAGLARAALLQSRSRPDGLIGPQPQMQTSPTCLEPASPGHPGGGRKAAAWRAAPEDAAGKPGSRGGAWLWPGLS